jgi:hypothetical protein
MYLLSIKEEMELTNLIVLDNNNSLIMLLVD